MSVTPMFPLEVAMLPGEELPLRIFEPRYAALVRDCLAADEPVFGVVLIEAGREVGGGDRRSGVGVLARIAECDATGAGRYRMRCPLGERIRIVEWLEDQPYPRAEVEPWPDEADDGVDAARLDGVEASMIALFERIASARGAELRDHDALLARGEPDLSKRLYALAARLPMGQADRYSILSAPGPAARLEALREAVETVTAIVEFELSE